MHTTTLVAWTLLLLIVGASCQVIPRSAMSSSEEAREEARVRAQGTPFPEGERVDAAALASAPYADWAHHHWVWFASRDANQTSMLQLAADYMERNIPVGAVDLDSLWSTGVNNFEWDTSKYPDAKGMIDQFHSKGIKVICWVTSMVDTDSSNFNEGKEKGYFLNDGKTIKWWHGHGAFIDYTNPQALDWWHAQMDNVLNVGVDGWKCDGTDPYTFELVLPRGHAGFITEREYADMYYGDFFEHTRKVRGPEALIMSRPVDSYNNLLYFRFSPRDTVFSGWVGDQDPTFEGLVDAMGNIVHSAWANYVNFGSDIGGYRTGGPKPLGRTKELFTRWFQMGAFVPLMENGGENEHRPWMFDEPGSNETLDTYRLFVHNHMELVPYLLTTGTQSFEQGISSIRPIAEHVDLSPSTYDYLLGDSILVSPVLKPNVSSWKVDFPKGDNWVDWWNPSDVYPGGSTVNYPTPLHTLPVFKKAGAMIPLHVEDAVTGHGDASYADAYTVMVHSPGRQGYQEVREHLADGMQLWYSRTQREGQLHFAASAHTRPVIFVIQGVHAPTLVLDVVHDTLLQQHTSHAQLSTARLGWHYDVNTNTLVIRPPADDKNGVKVQLQGAENLFASK